MQHDGSSRNQADRRGGRRRGGASRDGADSGQGRSQSTACGSKTQQAQGGGTVTPLLGHTLPLSSPPQGRLLRTQILALGLERSAVLRQQDFVAPALAAFFWQCGHEGGASGWLWARAPKQQHCFWRFRASAQRQMSEPQGEAGAQRAGRGRGKEETR
jgi:hypothetical protein